MSAPSEREELLRSAQSQRKNGTEVLNLPLLEAGSSLLSHLIFSYQQETGLISHIQSNDTTHNLVRALKKYPSRVVTLGWVDQRVVRMVDDAGTLLELSRGRCLGQVSQAVTQCKEQKTQFLMEILEDLKSEGEALAALV